MKRMPVMAGLVLATMMTGGALAAPAAPTNAAPAAPAAANPVDQLTPADLPGVTLSGTQQAFYTAMKYGPKPEDIVYFAVDMDREKLGTGNRKLKDWRCFIYQPVVHAKARKSEVFRLETTTTYPSFKPYEVPVTIQGWKGSARLQLIQAMGRRNWTMLVDLSLVGPQGQRAKLLLAQSDIKGLRDQGAGAIPALALPLDGKPTITISPDQYSRIISAELRLADWEIALPGAGNPITIKFVTGTGMSADSIQLRADPQAFIDEKIPSVWSAPLKRMKVGDYTMKSSVKLGPFGDVADEQPYGVVAPQKNMPPPVPEKNPRQKVR